MTNREKVVALLNSLETGEQAPVAYINPNKYIQHNLMVGDGLAAFGELLQHKPPQGFKVKVFRAFEDGDYVFTHTDYDFFGPKIGFDIFRFENGLIVEHWDNLQETVTVTKSGHSMIDGPATVSDLDKTAVNKVLVRSFYEEVLIGGDFDKITDYVSAEKYVQHNPGIADGISGLFTAVQQMMEAGQTMEVRALHLLLGEGDFVLGQSEGAFAGAEVTFYDLFRIENGKITEHWDVVEPLLPRDQWQNENGKF
ncbi:MAG: nuclear transport factor 2 family protein [Ardenticatenaceae bacterium]|nr:nuclear transport factor 2 family protein [Anaerolineales bacterium]MCB8923824.1 nuclear transport factor 2 family protein [Ardenticatenaceae bacterium]MCB9003397.1 nuclear transport factor 2 family protein [Ardenticatenaceae bacterium]